MPIFKSNLHGSSVAKLRVAVLWRAEEILLEEGVRLLEEVIGRGLAQAEEKLLVGA